MMIPRRVLSLIHGEPVHWAVVPVRRHLLVRRFAVRAEPPVSQEATTRVPLFVLSNGSVRADGAFLARCLRLLGESRCGRDAGSRRKAERAVDCSQRKGRFTTDSRPGPEWSGIL